MATQSPTAPSGASPLLAEYLTRRELAQGLRKTVRSLDRWLLTGDGPPYVQVGNTKLFRRDAVAAWLREREQGTSVNRPQSNGRRRGA
jgi:hypothetical protein